MKRTLFAIVIASGLHLFLSISAQFAALAASLPSFDNPDYEVSLVGRIADGTAGVLRQPGASIWNSWMSRNLPDALEWGVLLMNSVFWGIVLVLGIRFLGTRFGKGKRLATFEEFGLDRAR